MADQQDQLSSGGSVEKASASADTSKPRGKSSSSGSSGYRKRQSTGAIPDSVEEKRRRQTTGDPQTSQVDGNTAHTHSIDSSKGEGRIRGERRSHGAGLESYPGNYARCSVEPMGACNARSSASLQVLVPLVEYRSVQCCIIHAILANFCSWLIITRQRVSGFSYLCFFIFFFIFFITLGCRSSSSSEDLSLFISKPLLD